MKQILTPDAPAPTGHCSQAIVHKNVVYVAGQLSIYTQTGEKLNSLRTPQ